MSVGQKIKALRKEKGLTQSELANKLNVVSTAVSAWERDANKPMMDKLTIMSELFNVPISHFFDVEIPSNIIPLQPNIVQVPIIGKIACGDPITAVQNIEGYTYEFADFLPKGEIFALIAKGDSMEPTIANGSKVLVRAQSDVENGELAAVLVNGDEEATLKRVKKQGDTILLMPDNPAHEPIVVTESNPARIIGKIVRAIMDFD
ncbi:XRE family transcriptional regulator [Solibacillus sp. FSL R7-0668]|uniref:LexA family protein n=1 Tax=Solibacillus sp. FSL R7-0668 TaxID=2921688 RepID=UPI0030F70CD9